MPTDRATLPCIIVVMGVAGSGKSTIGRALASQLDWPYFEADDFHSETNRAKMSAGTPLTDDDRAPWLAKIREAIDACVAGNFSAVFTCSGLKQTYREVLTTNAPAVRLVYLHGDAATLLARLQQRTDHFMKPAMLESQLAALEVPTDAITVDIAQSPDAIVAEIRQRIGR